MGLASRRRALMAEKVDSAMIIKDIPTGVGFKFSETTSVVFIYLGVINGTAWLLRDQVISSASKMRSNSLCDYEGSIIDTYLTTTYYNDFSQRVKDACENTTITFPASDGSTVSNKTITRKVFLLTRGQVMNNDNGITSALKKYNKTTSGNDARISKDADGTARLWWLCSAKDNQGMYTIAKAGTDGSTIPNTSSGTIYRRPVISINKETKVKLIDGVYIMV